MLCLESGWVSWSCDGCGQVGQIEGPQSLVLVRKPNVRTWRNFPVGLVSPIADIGASFALIDVKDLSEIDMNSFLDEE
jgi:hypothetical protein